MAIVFKLSNGSSIKIDSNKLIGIAGYNEDYFLSLLKKNNVAFMDNDLLFDGKTVYEEIRKYYYGNNDNINMIMKELGLKEDIVKKNIDELSNSEKRLIKYAIVLLENKSILVINEPFLYFDLSIKKKIQFLLKSIVHNTNKTIIISSKNSNYLYDICDKILLVGSNDFYYDTCQNVFESEKLLKQYKVNIPEIVEFINICHSKGINLHYTYDIRDLIKEVYKNAPDR